MTRKRKKNEYSDSSKEWSEAGYALDYLEIADQIPYKKDGELVLLDHIPKTAERLLDLGTGDGRLIKLLRTNLSSLQEAVGLDISPTMLNMAEIISKTIIQLRLWHMTFRIHFQRI